ncbi:hypothetical protein ACWF9G_20675 [Nocardia sp. NPDC055029]
MFTSVVVLCWSKSMVTSNANRPYYGADPSTLAPPVKRLADCDDVYDFLEHNVRPRPLMWARGGSLQELETLLAGYSLALHVHSVPEAEEFALGPRGPFTEWLRSTYGWGMSMGWAYAIEQHRHEGETAIDSFFRLLDEYRRGQ